MLRGPHLCYALLNMPKFHIGLFTVVLACAPLAAEPHLVGTSAAARPIPGTRSSPTPRPWGTSSTSPTPILPMAPRSGGATARIPPFGSLQSIGPRALFQVYGSSDTE